MGNDVAFASVAARQAGRQTHERSRGNLQHPLFKRARALAARGAVVCTGPVAHNPCGRRMKAGWLLRTVSQGALKKTHQKNESLFNSLAVLKALNSPKPSICFGTQSRHIDLLRDEYRSQILNTECVIKGVETLRNV